MTKQSKGRSIVVVTTLCWAIIEWLLFELRRTPYRPPHDMKTLLGTERDGVVFVMGGLAVGWFLCLIMICLRSKFTRTDYVRFGLMLFLLAVIVGGLAMFPWWPVTPYELLWS